MKRCKWVNEKNPEYVKYHDTEWGVPKHDDYILFEYLILESFQAGLSWECILNKRNNFKEAFDNFDFYKISKYDIKREKELLDNDGIIRNKLKIKAAINNAKVFIKIRDEYGSFDKYIWSFTAGNIIKNKDDSFNTTSSLSDEISIDLKRKGMKFVGSTIIYSYLQAIGIINDHEIACDLYTNN